MLERPLVRESFFPTGHRTHLLEPARADDGPQIAAIARRHEPREAARLVARGRRSRDRADPGRPAPEPHRPPLGFVPVRGGPVEIGGVAYHVLVLDLGPASVDGWLGRLVADDLELDDELLDDGQRQLVLDGDRVDLTPLECDLLRYLLDREGSAVERRAILRDVWGTDWAGGSNTIETVISALRRKLGRHAGLIQTVRGVGYRAGRRS